MGGWYLPQIFRGNRVGTPKAAPQGVHGIEPNPLKIMKYSPSGPLFAFSSDGNFLKFSGTGV